MAVHNHILQTYTVVGAMPLGDKKAHVEVSRSTKSLRSRRVTYIATGGSFTDATMEVVLTADNNHTLLGTLVLEDIRLVATPSPADTSPVPRDYDDRGATMYAVAVILVYGFSIVLLIASHTYMKRKNGKTGDGEDMSTVTKYLEQVPHLQEISRKDSFRRLKMSLIPMVSIAIGRDISELPSKPVVPTPPRSPIATLFHNISDRLGTFTSDDDTTPVSPNLKSVRFKFDNEIDPFETSTYTPLVRSLSHRSETSGGGRERVEATKDITSHTGQGAEEGAGVVGREGQSATDKQTAGVSHVGDGGGIGGTLAESTGVRHERTATGGVEHSERKVDPGAEAIPDIGVKLPAAMPYIRLLSTSSGVSTAYTDLSSPCSPSSTGTTSSFPYNLADSYSSGVASDLQASSASNRPWLDGELLPPPSGTTRHHSPVAALPGVHQPKLLIHLPVQEPGVVVPPGGRWSNHPQSQVVQVEGAAQGGEDEEEPLVPLQITTV